MIQLYVKLIENGLRTIDDVPESLRDEVKGKLNLEKI